MACNALGMGIRDDGAIATILLHDVCKDCAVTLNELPVTDAVKHSVDLMTFRIIDGETKEIAKNRYYNEWFALGLEQIVLSIYSLDKTTLKTIRGNEVLLNKSLNAAKILSEHKENYNFTFVIQMVIMKDNYNEMAEILKFAIENNADIFWPSYLEET